MVVDGIGASVRRKEDRRLLVGKGNYTDDITLPQQAYAVFVRSMYAHAKITRIDAEAARQAPGVIGILTGDDVAADGLGGLPCGWLIKNKDGSNMVEPPHPALAHGKVRHVGDPVVMVVANSRAEAKAAAALVEIDYEVLPAVGLLADAAQPGAPLVWDEAPGNACYDWHIGDAATTDAAFAKAAHVVAIDLTNNRVAPNPMEPRAAIGHYESANDHYTLYTTSQNPHLIRLLMAAFTLHQPEHKIRVIAPDVGGGFGSKIFHYAEELLTVWASRRLDRPVKWTSDRSEAFQTDAHGRDHISHAELALDADHKFLGLRVRTLANMGAYLSTFASAVPTYLYATLLSGPYDFPAIYAEVKSLFTNTTPIDAYRGAGRPEASYLLERLVDKAARDLKVDPIALRRKNLIRVDQFPYQTQVALQYDIGDYQATLDMALEANDHVNYAARKADSAKRGKLRGWGMSTYIEACGIAPSAVAGALGARAGLYEAGTVRVHPTGSVTVFTGTHSHGQGHETTFAQLVAEKLGVSTDNVDVVHGDTDRISFGMGTYGSRSMAVGGSAIVKALDKVIDKGKKIAAHLLEASVGDIEFKDGNFRVVGTDRVKAFGEVAFTAYVPHNYPIDTVEPGLEEQAYYDPKNFTFPGGTHLVEVEIDPETGVCEVVDVTIADDVGVIINPMIVDGQAHGGLAQGIGQALFEEVRYDADGQLTNGSYMDYCMPRAADLPNFKVGNHVTACTHNPIGVKGVGECGAIGSPPAVINAVIDALSSLGVTDMSMPATPEKIWRAIQAAQRKGPEMKDFEFHKPASVQDAVALLRARDGAKVLAGGQSLLPVLKLELAEPTDLVSIAGLKELRDIRVDGDKLLIGALVTHDGVQRSPEVAKAIPALAALAGGIGDAQVRNRGTIGGSVAHADPAADYPAALLGLGATIITDRRSIAADAFFTGLFQTALEANELVTAVAFPIPKRAAYIKFAHRASKYALVGVLVAETAGGVRVAVTGAASTVFRLTAFEQALEKSMAASALDGIAVPAAGLNGDAEASAEYRAHLIGVMAKRAVQALA